MFSFISQGMKWGFFKASSNSDGAKRQTCDWKRDHDKSEEWKVLWVARRRQNDTAMHELVFL
jgi:hypothetical protein